MSVRDHSSSYRRGVLLGLTMAEIMILVIFLLLLTFAALLKKEDEKSSLIAKYKQTFDKIAQVVDKEEPDITEELVRAIENLPEMISLIEKSEIKENSESISDVLLRGIEKIKAEKMIEPFAKDIPIEEQLKKALEEKEQLKNDVSNIKGQNKSLIKQIESKGKGVDYPPCWADANGKPEYIYNVVLINDGIVIHDNHLLNRSIEQEKLPISQISYRVPLKMSTFQRQTYPLLKWGKDNDCRFFVRVYDETDIDQKDLYKQLLETVESSFYKVLM